VVPPPVASDVVAPTVGGVVVPAPSVGIFWRSPEPGALPFVEVGSRVAEGDVVGIVEVMKLMNNVHAPVAGVVRAIHVANAASVEYETPLMTIDEDR
jgi:biotin carboxyl carrier protein